MTPYSTFIKWQRRSPEPNPSPSLWDQVASDRSRVIYSSTFRRLQQKAQVFPLEDNSAVRSRLTHSLEVADLGRRIAQQITTSLIESGELEASLQIPFITIVETACLMHDMGNVPFGHFGELAIQDWFKDNWEDLYRESRTNITSLDK